MSATPPTAATVRELLRYEPSTGLFFWRCNRGSALAGDVAGGHDSDGYIQIKVGGCFRKAHRIAFLYMGDHWPLVVDHRNGVRDDNRWSNLRECDASFNQQNRRKAGRNSSTGLLGASIDRSTGLFRAFIKVGAKRLSLGSFPTAEEAHRVYLAAKRSLHEGCTV